MRYEGTSIRCRFFAVVLTTTSAVIPHPICLPLTTHGKASNHPDRRCGVTQGFPKVARWSVRFRQGSGNFFGERNAGGGSGDDRVPSRGVRGNQEVMGSDGSCNL